VRAAYTNGRYQIELHFKHANALVSVNARAEGQDVTANVKKLWVVVETGAQEQTFTHWGGPVEVFVPNGSKLKGVSVLLTSDRQVDIEYKSNLVFERNKRYTIQADIEANTLSGSASDNIEDWPESSSYSDKLFDSYGREIVYIRTAADLKTLSERVNYHGGERRKILAYQLADIDLGIREESWIPIGTWQYPFYNSIYDGNGFVITGLKVIRDTSYNGLFGCTINSNLRDIHIKDAYIDSRAGDNGVLAGWAGIDYSNKEEATDGYIKGCVVSGYVKGGNYHTAGLAGWCYVGWCGMSIEGNTVDVTVVIYE
jgi:hypothetical protein